MPAYRLPAKPNPSRIPSIPLESELDLFLSELTPLLPLNLDGVRTVAGLDVYCRDTKNKWFIFGNTTPYDKLLVNSRTPFEQQASNLLSQMSAAQSAYNGFVATIGARATGLAALRVRNQPDPSIDGQPIYEATEDLAGRVIRYLLGDGTHVFYRLRVRDLFTVDALQVAFQNLTARKVTADQVVTGSFQVAGSQFFTVTSSTYAWGIADANQRLVLWFTLDGTFHAAKPGPEFGGGGGSGGAVLSGQDILALLRAVLPFMVPDKVDNTRAGWGLRDASGRLMLWLDFKGQTRSALPLGAPNYDVAIWGDGMAAQLASRLVVPGTAVNLGYTNQTSADVAARFGAVTSLATFKATGKVSGVATLTLLSPSRSPLHGATTLTQSGRLGGVRGTLTRNATGQADALTNRTAYYTFTETAGQVLELNASLAWIPDNGYRYQTTIIAAGRNDLSSTDPFQETAGRSISDNMQSIIQTLDAGHQRFVVIGLLNRKTEIYGAGLENVLTYNTLTADVATANFYDPRRVMCRNADSSWRADGSPDPALMADDTTPNAAGFAALAADLRTFMDRRGL